MLRPWLHSLILMMLVNSFLASSARGDEEQLAELFRRSGRILIGTPDESVNLREAGQVQVQLDRALRGRGRKAEQLTIGHDGSETEPQLEAGKQYLLLLRPDGDRWVFVGQTAMPFSGGSVAALTPEGKPVPLEAVQGLIDKNPSNPESLLPQRTTPAGRWIVLFTSQDRSIPVWIVDIVSREGRYSVEVIDTDGQFSASRIPSFRITDETVRFLIEAVPADNEDAKLTFDFVGRLKDGAIIGNMLVDNRGLGLVKMQATGATKMSQVGEPQLVEGQAEFAEAATAEDSFTAYQRFAEDHPLSPLTPNAYQMMLASETAARLKEQEVRELTAKMFDVSEIWGDRVREQMTIDAAAALAKRKQFPEFALALLDGAQTRIETVQDTDNLPVDWQHLIRINRAVMLQETGKSEEAIAVLREARAERPLQPHPIYYLARFLEAAGQDDEAMQYYAELAILPGMKDILEQFFQGEEDFVLPVERLSHLWRQKKGSETGLRKYMLDVYREKLHSFVTEKVPPRGDDPAAGNRVALVELFTGAQCPPCVAADIGTGWLEQTYAHTEVIVLRYHVHSPGPDPLTGAANDERMGYYNAMGTPTVAINGSPMTAGGYIIGTRRIFEQLRDRIEPILKETSDVKLALNASVEDEKISISARAERPEKFQDNIKLRLALVEEEIPFVASNGVLLHEMLVRTMPGGAIGIEPNDGKLEFQSEIKVEDFQKEILQGLTSFEQAFSNGTGTEFAFKLKPIGPKKLYLAAFVQDDQNKQVLQSAIIPIKGSFQAAE